jgi:hypothetical protein
VGLTATHVPYKGSVEAMPDLLSERVDMLFLDGLQAVSYVKSGELRAVGTTMVLGEMLAGQGDLGKQFCSRRARSDLTTCSLV